MIRNFEASIASPDDLKTHPWVGRDVTTSPLYTCDTHQMFYWSKLDVTVPYRIANIDCNYQWGHKLTPKHSKFEPMLATTTRKLLFKPKFAEQ